METGRSGLPPGSTALAARAWFSVRRRAVPKEVRELLLALGVVAGERCQTPGEPGRPAPAFPGIRGRNRGRRVGRCGDDRRRKVRGVGGRGRLDDRRRGGRIFEQGDFLGQRSGVCRRRPAGGSTAGGGEGAGARRGRRERKLRPFHRGGRDVLGLHHWSRPAQGELQALPQSGFPRGRGVPKSRRRVGAARRSAGPGPRPDRTLARLEP